MVDTWGYAYEVHKDTIAGLKARLATAEAALRHVVDAVQGDHGFPMEGCGLCDAALAAHTETPEAEG